MNHSFDGSLDHQLQKAFLQGVLSEAETVRLRDLVESGADPEKAGEIFFRFYAWAHSEEYQLQSLDFRKEPLRDDFDDTTGLEALLERVRSEGHIPSVQGPGPVAVPNPRELRLLTPVGEHPAERFLFYWEDVPGNDGYVFELFDTQGEKIWEQGTDAACVEFPRLLATPEPDEPLQWRVTTNVEGKRISQVATILPFDVKRVGGYHGARQVEAPIPPAHSGAFTAVPSPVRKRSPWLVVMPMLAAAVVILAVAVPRFMQTGTDVPVPSRTRGVDRATPTLTVTSLQPHGDTTDTRPVFRWESTTEIDSYRFTLLNDELSQIHVADVSGTSLAFPETLPALNAGEIYIWKLEWTESGQSRQATRTFRVTSDAP